MIYFNNRNGSADLICRLIPFIPCSKYKKARGLVVLGEGKGAVML